MFQAYTILYSIALVFLLPFEFFKRPAALRFRWLAERFGRIPSVEAQKTVMIHAVSVGEVIASEPLVKRLKSDYPQLNIVISTVTDTGQKVAGERIGRLAKIIYVPFDLPCAVSRMLDTVKPQLFIIMETELWPNLLRSLYTRGIPAVLMNGRISERSFKGYCRLRFFFMPLLRMLSLLCIQTEVYAERIKSLGADPSSVVVTGSLKFDTRPSGMSPEWTAKLKGMTIIGGSTHATEEQLLVESFSALSKKYPDINLVLAPRHPERFNEVIQLVKNLGMRYVRRSDIGNDHPDIRGMIIILDVMGELSSVYASCSIAVMGGSFIEHGGQNLLEPAYYAKAIVCGPHMENFPFAQDFYAEGAALRTDREGLTEMLDRLISSPGTIQTMGAKAKDLCDKNAGALDRSVEAIKKYL
ncbi:MAG: 3-deoxy-D-manno-octulosonic acid transferase [Nitrospiraceae bacterium]|nr:3-deoxy-D-manno-octulosonic acid transferase [Nitrospiraceae bacterium]